MSSPKNQQGAAGYVLRTDSMRHISGCALVNIAEGMTCSYHLNVQYNSTVRDGHGGFKVIRFVQHNCQLFATVVPRKPASAFSSRQLAPIISPKLMNNAQYTPKNVLADVFPAYTKLKPTKSFCNTVLDDARDIVTGQAQETIHRLPAYCQALRACQHKVKVMRSGMLTQTSVLTAGCAIVAETKSPFSQEYYLDYHAMRIAIVQRMQADHNMAERHKLVQDRKAFDVASAAQIAEKTCPEGTHRHLWGISYAPSTTIAVFDAFEEIDQTDALMTTRQRPRGQDYHCIQRLACTQKYIST